MPENYDLYDDATGALLRQAVPLAEAPGDPIGKSWKWKLHDKPEPTATHDVTWDTATRAFVLVALDPAASAVRLDAIAAELIAKVKADAGDIILAYLPDWKQRNMTARGVQILRKIQAATATSEEIAEADAIEAAFDNVVAIRAASDAAEAAITAARAADDETAMQAAALASWPTPA